MTGGERGAGRAAVDSGKRLAIVNASGFYGRVGLVQVRQGLKPLPLDEWMGRSYGMSPTAELFDSFDSATLLVGSMTAIR